MKAKRFLLGPCPDMYVDNDVGANSTLQSPVTLFVIQDFCFQRTLKCVSKTVLQKVWDLLAPQLDKKQCTYRHMHPAKT